MSRKEPLIALAIIKKEKASTQRKEVDVDWENEIQDNQVREELGDKVRLENRDNQPDFQADQRSNRDYERIFKEINQFLREKILISFLFWGGIKLFNL